MYQFKYQTTPVFYFYPSVEPVFSCIVPADWLSLDLPTIGGRVNYSNSREQLSVCGYAIFEFGEIFSSAQTQRKFSVDIRLDGKKCFEQPLIIHAPNSAQSEVVLLNHLVGFLAPSAWVAVDIADLIGLLEGSSTYYLKFGEGESLPDILSDILEPETYKDVRCEFLMIFGDNQKLKLDHLHEAMGAMACGRADAAADLSGIACMVGVEQDARLVSILVGRKNME